MTTDYVDEVGGESALELLESLRGLSSRPTSDGMVDIEGRVSPAVVRAMMRLEAELLIEDADLLSIGGNPDRDPSQRCADAFALMCTLVTEALGLVRP